MLRFTELAQQKGFATPDKERFYEIDGFGKSVCSSDYYERKSLAHPS